MKRKDAFVAGMEFYNTGTPCSRNHVADRRTMNGACLDCERENNKAWRERNADHARAYARNYQAKRSSVATDEWLEKKGSGEIYERWVRLFKSFDADDAAHYIRTASSAMILKAAGDVFRIQRVSEETFADYRNRLLEVVKP